MRLPYFEYHSFPDGDAPFTGNPAGVCLLEAFPSDAVLRGIAESNKHAETAYLVAKTDEADAWDLRWFTPSVEVDLCGHATLAAGAALFDVGLVKGGTAAFDTRSGRLTIARTEDGLAMSLPASHAEPANMDPRIGAAMGGVAVEAFLKSGDGDAEPFFLAVLESEAAVHGLTPDIRALGALDLNLIVTAKGESADIVSRFFAPAFGIDEDPVTGAAHCLLAPYWAGRLGKTRLTARQIGPRPGALTVEYDGGDRVTLLGQARKYLAGEIFI